MNEKEKKDLENLKKYRYLPHHKGISTLKKRS